MVRCCAMLLVDAEAIIRATSSSDSLVIAKNICSRHIFGNFFVYHSSRTSSMWMICHRYTWDRANSSSHHGPSAPRKRRAERQYPNWSRHVFVYPRVWLALGCHGYLYSLPRKFLLVSYVHWFLKHPLCSFTNIIASFTVQLHNSLIHLPRK